RRRIVFEAHRVPRRGISRRLMRQALPHTLAVVVLNRHLADAYRVLGVAEEKIAVVPSAVDRRKFQRRTCWREMRERMHVAEAAPLVVYAGSLLKEKGVHTLLESARRVPEANFVILGGWPRIIPELEGFCRERGI